MSCIRTKAYILSYTTLLGISFFDIILLDHVLDVGLIYW